MKHYEKVIKNGRVLDTAAGIDKIANLCINGSVIEDISEEPVSGTYEINAEGCMVSPGFIDFHTHLFNGGSEYGINPDFMISQGVTSAVDAGTAGSAGFESFYKSVIEKSALTIKAFVSLGATGLSDPNHHQDYAEEKVNIGRIKELKRLYPETILGLKVSLSKAHVGELGKKPVATAVRLAEEIGDMSVCVHSTDPPCDAAEILELLRPGDILCHCYHGTGSCILNEEGEVRKEYREGREKGIIFDMANGISHFSHKCAKAALEQDFYPDVISSDMVSFAYGVSPRNRSLPYVMSKMMSMGMSEGDVLKRVTEIPAKLMNMEGKIGTLSSGADADICIFKIEDQEVAFEDAMNTNYVGKKLLIPQMTIKRGAVAFFQNSFNLKEL